MRAARGTRDVQVPGVENLGYLVGGLAASEDVRGGLGSVPGFPAFDGTASSGLQGIGALVRQSLTRSRCRPSHTRAGPGARRTRYSDVPCDHCDALPASLAHKAAKTATARLWPCSRRDGLGDRAEAVSAALRAAAEARSRYSRCSQRFSASNCQFQCRFLRSSPLAAVAVIIVRPRDFLLRAAACRLSRAFMRRLQPRAATLTWPRVHATAGRQAGACGPGRVSTGQRTETGHGQEMKD